MAEERKLIKCVVWDLDNTLWPGIAVEDSPEVLPDPDPAILDIIEQLERRGIVSSLASRNDPSLLRELVEHPPFKGRFVSPQVSWEPKSQSVRRIAKNLNIGLDALAFVDDSPFERAEVTYMLPQVTVLSPEEMLQAAGTPPFKPERVTAEAEGRAEMYRAEEKRRQAESEFGGSRADFLAWCDMRLTIARAATADLPRIVELTERTHQLNSTGRRYSAEEMRERMEESRWLVPSARLTDRFGDYGLIGAALVDREAPGDGVWLAELVMLSCRVEGRGIPAALLRWIMGEAQAAGMRSLRAVYRANERNLPVRLLFRQMGFEPTGEETDEGLTVVERDLTGELPSYPEWLQVTSGAEAVK
jgi:FkbH-like protein